MKNSSSKEQHCGDSNGRIAINKAAEAAEINQYILYNSYVVQHENDNQVHVTCCGNHTLGLTKRDEETNTYS